MVVDTSTRWPALVAYLEIQTSGTCPSRASSPRFVPFWPEVDQIPTRRECMARSGPILEQICSSSKLEAVPNSFRDSERPKRPDLGLWRAPGAHLGEWAARKARLHRCRAGM